MKQHLRSESGIARPLSMNFADGFVAASQCNHKAVRPCPGVLFPPETRFQQIENQAKPTGSDRHTLTKLPRTGSTRFRSTTTAETAPRRTSTLETWLWQSSRLVASQKNNRNRYAGCQEILNAEGELKMSVHTQPGARQVPASRDESPT